MCVWAGIGYMQHARRWRLKASAHWRAVSIWDPDSTSHMAVFQSPVRSRPHFRCFLRAFGRDVFFRRILFGAQSDGTAADCAGTSLGARRMA